MKWMFCCPGRDPRFSISDIDSKMSETQLLNPDYSGKFIVYLGEMMPEGAIETLDMDTITRGSKFKNI